jgi:disulfide bond formation protein DsbB
MVRRVLNSVYREPAAVAAAAVALGGLATILGAYAFQYGMGLAPCPLCLEQRVPYYVAIPLAALIAVAAWRRAPRGVLVGGLIVTAAVLLWGTGLAVYHAGVEWHWWAGPQDCAASAAQLGTARDLLAQMREARVVRCDEAAWRFLGLSLAGWNVLISLGLAAIALWGAAASGPSRKRSASQIYTN